MKPFEPKLSIRAKKRIAAVKGKLLLKSAKVVTDHYGARYQTTMTGAVMRLDAKPWRGKFERRQVIKMRRTFKPKKEVGA